MAKKSILLGVLHVASCSLLFVCSSSPCSAFSVHPVIADGRIRRHTHDSTARLDIHRLNAVVSPEKRERTVPSPTSSLPVVTTDTPIGTDGDVITPTLKEIELRIPPQITVTESQTNDDETAYDKEEYNKGLIIVGIITLLFSSMSPALHFALTDVGAASAPPVLLLNAAVSIIALLALLSAGPLLESATPTPKSLLRYKNKTRDTAQEEEERQRLIAGLELGLWKFLGTTANLYGLSLTTADHGAFLIQLTTLIVPVAQGIMGVPIPNRIRYSIGLALMGVFLFTQQEYLETFLMHAASSPDAATEIAANDPGAQVLLGDALCVVAAGFYATYDLRLFKWGKMVPPRQLITSKIATQAVLSALLLFVAGYTDAADYVSTIHHQISSSVAASGDILEAIKPFIPLGLVTLWSGAVINAVAPFIQVTGQQAVGPTRAQTLYASQPLWAAVLSYFCLGETVSKVGLVGGAAFLSALFLAATAEPPDPDCGEIQCEVD